MNREVHVRFCESRGVRFPPATRHNAVAESFFATIKRELIDTRAWPTRAGLHRAVFDYIEGWYNTRRLHSSLDYCSPAEWEHIHHNAHRQAA
jgi:putative transposase